MRLADHVIIITLSD